jgi:2-polyprenyl-3-methyl-5-hydroxy-6-metoxy-1,4-benzoquinol methylase
MSLAADYKKQFGWRDWPSIFEALPPLQGKTILDLGCAVGDQAAEFGVRGAHIIGVDMNEELLQEAQSRRLPNAEFRNCDLCATCLNLMSWPTAYGAVSQQPFSRT